MNDHLCYNDRIKLISAYEVSITPIARTTHPGQGLVNEIDHRVLVDKDGDTITVVSHSCQTWDEAGRDALNEANVCLRTTGDFKALMVGNNVPYPGKQMLWRRGIYDEVPVEINLVIDRWSLIIATDDQTRMIDTSGIPLNANSFMTWVVSDHLAAMPIGNAPPALGTVVAQIIKSMQIVSGDASIDVGAEYFASIKDGEAQVYHMPSDTKYKIKVETVTG